MSNPIFQKLEEKIDLAMETIELLRLQLEEFDEKNQTLQAENTSLKTRQSQWENSLSSLLRKLEGADLTSGSLETTKMEMYEREEDATV